MNAVPPGLDKPRLVDVGKNHAPENRPVLVGVPGHHDDPKRRLEFDLLAHAPIIGPGTDFDKRWEAIDTRLTLQAGFISTDNTPMTSPHVSILIPNYNNGAESSQTGDRNFIDELIRSLISTLGSDPTELEIIIADDGSTDDSLETCRMWARRTWPTGVRRGRPILRLMEFEHCGVLSVMANRLVREAKGSLLVRLDGDIVVHTENWASELCRVFKSGPPRLGVVGPLQLLPGGSVHSTGDWVLHPRGYHHLNQGAMPDQITRAIEVDHVMGCFYCFRREVWDEIGEFDETILRGQTVDFGLRARLHDWRTFFIPTISFTHTHCERKPRDNVADSEQGKARSESRFFEKWGFNRLAPDLDVVADKYAGTPLLWNARIFGAALDWPPISQGPRDLKSTQWQTYASDETIRPGIDACVDFVDGLAQTHSPRQSVLQFACGAGLLPHLLAKRGIASIGVDPDPELIRLAQQVTSGEDYPGESPRYVVQDDRRRIPLQDRSVDTVLLLNVLEWHANPVGLLEEVQRVLQPGGLLAIVTSERPRPADEDSDLRHRYREHELLGQLHNMNHFEMISPPDAGSGTLRLLVRSRSDGSVSEVKNLKQRRPSSVSTSASMIQT